MRQRLFTLCRPFFQGRRNIWTSGVLVGLSSIAGTLVAVRALSDTRGRNPVFELCGGSGWREPLLPGRIWRSLRGYWLPGPQRC